MATGDLVSKIYLDDISLPFADTVAEKSELSLSFITTEIICFLIGELVRLFFPCVGFGGVSCPLGAQAAGRQDERSGSFDCVYPTQVPGWVSGFVKPLRWGSAV